MDPHLAVLAGDEPQGEHRTLAERAFETLRSEIVTGQLKPGARLPIEELAERLQMSPMPIREAVRRLDARGLAVNIPHRGARVSALTLDDLADVYEVRFALESLAIRRAAQHFTKADAVSARRSLRYLHAMEDDSSAATSAAHTEFHFALYGISRSAWLLRLIRPVWDTCERYCVEAPECRQLAGRKAEHTAIVAACEANNPERAVAALCQHLAVTANSIAVAMGGQPLYELAA